MTLCISFSEFYNFFFKKTEQIVYPKRLMTMIGYVISFTKGKFHENLEKSTHLQRSV